MDDKENLERAKREYTPGTKFKIIGGSGFASEDGNETTVPKDVNIKLHGNNISYYGLPGYIYHDGKWADIIEPVTTTPQFVVGKWYKILAFAYQAEYYIKVSDIDGKRLYGEYINNGSFHKRGGFDQVNLVSSDVISEIQQYLPDGHVDKIAKTPEFIVGKWYKNLSTYNFVAKFEKMVGDTFCTNTGYIDEKRYIMSTHGKITAEIGNAKEASYEDYGPYLPDGHVDKQKTEGYISGIDSVGNVLRFVKYKKRKDDYFTYDYVMSPEKGQYVKLSNHTYTFKDVRDLTFDEIKWLNTCIEKGVFISKEEALKPSIPEYVECIRESSFFGKLGKIYKVKTWPDGDSDIYLEEDGFGLDRERFKPSTKEAYLGMLEKELLSLC